MELLSVDKLVVQLFIPDQESLNSTGVVLLEPLDENDECVSLKRRQNKVKNTIIFCINIF